MKESVLTRDRDTRTYTSSAATVKVYFASSRVFSRIRICFVPPLCAFGFSSTWRSHVCSSRFGHGTDVGLVRCPAGNGMGADLRTKRSWVVRRMKVEDERNVCACEDDGTDVY